LDPDLAGMKDQGSAGVSPGPPEGENLLAHACLVNLLLMDSDPVISSIC
jgi:hypothetical protein